MNLTKHLPRMVVLACLLLIGTAVVTFFSTATSSRSFLHAQEPPPDAAEKKWEFVGVASCAGCHEKPTAIYERTGATKFVKLDESQIWFTQDKHSKAMELIDPAQNPLAKQICEKLQIADIQQAKECLSCHANWQYHAKSDMWAERPKFHQFGVSCESCHGAASGWLKPHTEPAWRKLSPAAKEELGFVEVRNPIARARQCFACHVGDASQGKFVTHEMYAAGHPPLPGVELETFAYSMPPHWRHIHEKPEFEFRDEFEAANPSATAGGEFFRSRGALLSAVVAMQSSLDLVANNAADTNSLPDFALFDCYACHHELKSPAWRQARQVVGAPGRPRPAVWPVALIDAAIAFAHEDAQAADVASQSFREALAKYAEAFNVQPFGRAEKIVEAQQALSAELDSLLVDVQKSPSDKAAIERAFAKLASPTQSQTLDYDAARQTAWALRVLAQDLNRPLPEPFAADLHLSLPATQTQSITDDLPARLKALSEYDPAAFRAALEALKN